MVPFKSLDESKIIAALLHDVHNVHGSVFNTRSCRLTVNQVNKRLRTEGMGFLTKSLPRLGKAFDKAIAGGPPLNAKQLCFAALPDSELPRFLGEFFSRVLRPDGGLLQHPCAISVQIVRQICYLFYKYELPYSAEQEQHVIQKFEKTEEDLSTISPELHEIARLVDESYKAGYGPISGSQTVQIARIAKGLLAELFATFDPKDIYPRHGPGAVATKQKLWDKYLWTNVSASITEKYPFDEYFCSSGGHVCDTYESFKDITDKSLPARVILVPKDSRGPRLISCEPVDYQWVQQGLGRAMVELVESHVLTKYNVHFTDQSPNRIGALSGSENGRYSTLDLNEASDRVSADLVRLLFPEHVYTYLEACRSSSTVLPDGKVLALKKFAPMGSCLCFPVLALTVWAILTAGSPDAYTRERILVYGDDVIVPTAQAANAIEQLESFGLKVNRDKSCTSGLFRESCGMDAFAGKDVTPVRLRTVWSSTPSADVYTSWIAYANSFYSKRYYAVYDLIVERLIHIYGSIPGKALNTGCPSLAEVPTDAKPIRRRWNKNLQKFEYRVRAVKSPQISHTMNGWSMLLRHFAETGAAPRDMERGIHQMQELPIEGSPAFSVGQYTDRGTSVLVQRWR